MWTLFDAKLTAIAIVSVGTFFFGILPAFLGLGSRCQRSVTLSAVLCFGGGVLLATSLVHILPEARESLLKWTELLFCLGFFAIYFVDVVLQVIYNIQDNCTTSEDDSLLGSSNQDCYGSIAEAEEAPAPQRQGRSRKSTFSNYGLILAFCVHSLLEGLVVGVQTTPHSVMLLVGAVCSHKLVVAFCLGAELCSDGRSLSSLLPPISLYAAGSSLGIGLGMFLHNSSPSGVLIPSLQVLAGGTLLYIVLCEILPRERSKGLPHFTSAVQFLSVLIGFVIMVLLSFYV